MIGLASEKREKVEDVVTGKHARRGEELLATLVGMVEVALQTDTQLYVELMVIVVEFAVQNGDAVSE